MDFFPTRLTTRTKRRCTRAALVLTPCFSCSIRVARASPPHLPPPRAVTTDYAAMRVLGMIFRGGVENLAQVFFYFSLLHRISDAQSDADSTFISHTHTHTPPINYNGIQGWAPPLEHDPIHMRLSVTRSPAQKRQPPPPPLSARGAWHLLKLPCVSMARGGGQRVMPPTPGRCDRPLCVYVRSQAQPGELDLALDARDARHFDADVARASQQPIDLPCAAQQARRRCEAPPPLEHRPL